MHLRTTQTLPAVIFAALALALAYSAVTGHGYGTPRVLNEPTGPYVLSIWTDPEPLRADETHVVVAVIDPATQALIVSDVTVTVRMQSLEDPAQSFTQVAGPDNTNRLLFAAEFNDQVTSGPWQVGVSAAGAAGQGEEVNFEVPIEPARGFNWLWIGAGGLVLLLVVWLGTTMRSGSSRRPARTPTPGVSS